jgi:hypothetical protein
MPEVSINDPIEKIIAAMDNPVSAYDAPYTLMGRENGKDVTEIGHLIRSLTDLLTTPYGSMPTLREYGCRLFEYIDRPMNAELRLDMLAAIYSAIDRWEPRLFLHTVSLELGAHEGQLLLNLTGYYLLEGRGVVLNNVTLDFKKDQTLNTYALSN